MSHPAKLNRINKRAEIIPTTKERNKDHHLLRPIIQKQSLKLSQINKPTSKQAGKPANPLGQVHFVCFGLL